MTNKVGSANETQADATRREEVRQALFRLRRRGTDLPPVDAVLIVREERQVKLRDDCYDAEE